MIFFVDWVSFGVCVRLPNWNSVSHSKFRGATGVESTKDINLPCTGFPKDSASEDKYNFSITSISYFSGSVSNQWYHATRTRISM